jgi:hypothetical protein
MTEKEEKNTIKLTPKKVGRKQPKVTNEEIADALRKTHGIIAKAAALLSKEKSDKSDCNISITRSAVSQRIKKNIKLQEVHDEAVDALLDHAEDELFRKIFDGDMTAIIFYLKCKGKKRGYIERQSLEVSGIDGASINLSQQQAKSDLSILTDEELRNYAAICEKLAAGDEGRSKG